MVIENANFAPIIIFCFKRVDTLNKCVENLKSCPESEESDLIIYSDAARNEYEYTKVNEVRNFLKNISGFKSTTIIEREINLGVDFNIINGIIEMSQKFDKFIIVEDDIVVNHQFLSFLNACLNFYEHENDIITVTGFNYVKVPLQYKWDCYFTGRSNPWGWATWSSKIKDVDWEILDKDLFIDSKVLQRKFNFWGSDLTRMLKKTINSKIRAWDIRLDYFMFKKNKMTIYPCKNLVLNIGFNRSDASNTIGYNRFKINTELYNNTNFKFPDFITDNKQIKYKYISRNNFFNRFITRFYKLVNFYNPI